MNAVRRLGLAFLCSLAFAASGSAQGPKRIVSLIPSHSEILKDLGAQDRLVGVSDVESDGAFPDLPRVGGVQPNWEALTALKPDLVLADTSHARHRDIFDRLKLPVIFLPGTDVPKGKRPRVYFEIWPLPIQAAARISLRGHRLELAGAENIVPPSKNLTAMVSLEWVPEQAPDVILHTGVIKGSEIAARPGWDRIPAVKSGRIYAVDRDRFSRASGHIVEAFEQLVDLLYGTKR